MIREFVKSPRAIGNGHRKSPVCVLKEIINVRFHLHTPKQRSIALSPITQRPVERKTLQCVEPACSSKTGAGKHINNRIVFYLFGSAKGLLSAFH